MKGSSVFLIDQNALPFSFKIFGSNNYKDTCIAIRTMIVRGAGAIGAAAGFAMAQAFLKRPDDDIFLKKAKKEIEMTRPTAQNLFSAVTRVFNKAMGAKDRGAAAAAEAQKIADEDAMNCRKIGKFGSSLIKKGCNILTHCNAGWLAFVDNGSALSPIYAARDKGKKPFVYVDETRPRDQGARLTAWELKNENIPFAIIADNAAAHLMSLGKIDLVIVGADRIAANGDTANKIGTLEKAIAAKEFGIPFYVAAPTSTIDITCSSGKDIPVEERSEDEVLFMSGMTDKGKIERVRVCAPNSRAVNPAFDITPSRYIRGIITEKGMITPSKKAIGALLRS